MKDLFNEYGRKARLMPAVLCLPPFLLLKSLFADHLLDPAISKQLLVVAIGDVSLAVAFTYLLIHINRLISKLLFERKDSFPTTQMLLPSSGLLSDELRVRLHQKILADFQLALPSRSDEQSDLIRAGTRIKEIVALIINRVGDGRLLLQHNIEYGFFRNFFGGSAVALLVSLAGMILFRYVDPQLTAFKFFGVLVGAYLVALIVARPVLRHYSYSYADILFREYLGGA